MPIVITKDGKAAERELNGVWVDYEEGELLIARMGNPMNRKVYQRLMKPYEQKQQRGTLPTHIKEQVVCQCYAETLLLDWRNLVDEEGNPIEYSQDIAYQALLNDQDLREFVELQSTNQSLFRDELIEKSSGKLSPKSNGVVDGGGQSTHSTEVGEAAEKNPTH